jgi:hypothetical protein
MSMGGGSPGGPGGGAGMSAVGGATAPVGSGGMAGSNPLNPPASTAGSGGGPSGDAGSTATGGAPLDCTQPTAPRAPLRRMTRFEYNNTVRELLAVTTRPADALPGEEAGTGFGNDADALGVSRLLVDGYRSVAEQIAKDKTLDAAGAVATAGCDPASTGEQACAQQFITGFLGRAFRRAATPEDITAYSNTFSRGREIGGSFAMGVRAVLARALQAPQFLYRVEFGETVDAARNLARPTGYEMAARLSYLLWGSMPDPQLMSAAQEGKLNTAEGVRLQAERMLADDRAREVTRHFHGMLFGTLGLDHLERNSDFYPTYRAGMGALFRQETELFLNDVIWNGSGDLTGIFSAPYTFVNGTLATFYGIPNVTGDGFQKVQLDGIKRLGLLTQASILALTTPGSRTDPVVRGKWVYTKLLCGRVGDPPPNVPKLPDPVPGVSVRERLAMHRDSPACSGCHRVMDPIGFGFEHYDGVGLWRDMDDGVVVDDSGAVEGTDIAGPFKGLAELGQKLSQSSDLRNCFVGHWQTFAYGRAENPQDQCTRASLQTAFAQSNGNIKQLLVALTQTDAFLYRPVVAPGL